MVNKRRLQDLARNPNLIRGIFNYCDRWCERCTFTARCLTFQMEQDRAARLPSETNDLRNPAFWKDIDDNFSLAREMVEELMRREGITITEEDMAAAAAAEHRDDERVRRHPLTRAAYAHIGRVDAWFKTGRAVWRAKGKELQQAFDLRLPGRAPRRELAELHDAVEVIRFYQHFLYPKLSRALHGRLEGDPYGDASGSAKIALIALDRSLEAWKQILAQFPEREEATLPLLQHVEQLRRTVEATFPKARAFARPGFDEPAS